MIDLDKLPAEAIFEFSTTSGTLYRLKKISDERFLVLKGGSKYFSSPREVVILGSSFRSPLMAPGVIKQGMCVEMSFPEENSRNSAIKVVTTSSVASLRVVPREENQN
jgi:hypothetical protein